MNFLKEELSFSAVKAHFIVLLIVIVTYPNKVFV